LPDLLEAQAAVIAQAGHAGWGNLMLTAAAALMESEEWRRDAERYRWLRERPWQACHTIFPNAPWIHEGHEGNQLRMDAAIDAARKEGV
jgi:hypothetical protein